jgi:hypothetical protein
MSINFIFVRIKASHMNFNLFINMFRYIVLGEFKHVLLNENRLEIHDGHYLNGSVFEENTLAPAEHEGMFHLEDKIVCMIDIDDLNDDSPRELTPFTDSPMVSTDGIPILSRKAAFQFKLFNDIGNAHEFENKLVFGSECFQQGMGFEFIQRENNIYIHSLGENDNRCLCPTDDERVELSDEVTPENHIQLIPRGEYPGLFIMSDGEHYYQVQFYKGSYGEVECAEHMDDATLFQLISL